MISTRPFYAVTFAGKRYDCGLKAGYLKANLAAMLCREEMGAEIRAFALNLLAN